MGVWGRQISLAGLFSSLFILGCARAPIQEPTTLDPLANQHAGPQVMIEGSSLVLIEDAESTPLVVYFGVDSDVVDPAKYDVLDALAAFLNSHGDELRVEVQGHADERGPDVYNEGLSLRRARAVERYLIERGVDPGRVRATGFGEQRPLVDHDDSYRSNRRVEFVTASDSSQLSDALTAVH